MQRLNLEELPKAFRDALALCVTEREGTALEMDGKVVAYIIPKYELTKADEPWSDAKNDRRCDLIDKKHDGRGLTLEEIRELHQLQSELSYHVRKVAPLPIEQTRKLHQQLVMEAIQSAS